MRRSLVYIVICLLFALPFGLAQESASNRAELDQQSFESIQSELDLDKTKRGLISRTFTKKEKDISLDPNIGTGAFAFMGLFKMLAYIGFALLLLVIIGFILHSIVQGRKDVKITEVDEEEHIDDIDTISGYNQAMSQGNYRLAIRMRFIKVLQILQDKKWIEWKLEKTNRTYSSELSGKQPHESFVTLANHYERIWYGNTGISRSEFIDLEPQYLKFVKTYE